MKGYKVEDRLYIFPQTVDVIPEVEGVEVIYIQHENVKAWKEANSAVADKIKGYNFLTITALPKEWAGHTDDDIEPAPEPETRSLEVTDALEAIFQIFDNKYNRSASITLSKRVNLPYPRHKFFNMFYALTFS